MATSLPYVTATLSPSTPSPSLGEQRVLIVGSMITGTATSGELIQNIGNDAEENALFGRNSQLAGMVRAFKEINKVTAIDAIGITDNGSGVAAAGAVAFSGTASAAGTLYITVGSYVNHRYAVAVASGDTATEIGETFEGLVNADLNAPFTALNTTGTVALTADNDGTEGNFFTIRVEGTVAGVTPSVTAFTSGATNPVVTTLFDVIDGIRYQTIVYPSSWTVSALTTLLDSRFNTDNSIMDGVGIITSTDTYANLVTAGDSYNTQNLTLIGNRTIADTLYKGSALMELNGVISAQFAAIRSLRLTEDANIASYVTSTNGALDYFGGAAIASLPYFNTPFYNLPLIPIAKQFDLEETQGLNDAGVSILNNNLQNTRIIADQILTTYKTNAAGVEDPTWKYLEYVDTSSAVREYFFNALKGNYAQTRLTEGDLQPGRNMANAQTIAAYIDGLYTTLAGSEYVLVQAGETAFSYFKSNRTVTLNLATGTATVNMVVPIVAQLRQFIVPIQISFSTSS